MGAHLLCDGRQKAAVGGVNGETDFVQGVKSPGGVQRACAEIAFGLGKHAQELIVESGLPADRIQTAHFARRS